jgi:translation initiation factor 6
VANDESLLVPETVPLEKVKGIAKCLNVEPIAFNLTGYLLNGVMMVCNSHGILLPHFAFPEDINRLSSLLEGKLVVDVLPAKETSLGNIILTNNKGAIVHPGLSPVALQIIKDVLNVEVERGRIAGLPIVGSLAVANDKGVITHPNLSEEEKELIKSVLRGSVDVGTVNGGVPYVRSGMVVNDKGVVVGNSTTGPEMLLIEAVFG